MKIPYSVSELQSVPHGSKHYSSALRILARLGALEVEQSLERKSKLEKETMELAASLYIPKAGDILSFENSSTGFRYRCTVKEVRSDGWLIGDPISFHESHWTLLDVVRNNKQIFRW